MTAHAQYDHIEGLRYAEPVGAVLTVGEKDRAKGQPINTNRFFLKLPNEEKHGEIKLRPNHPAFAAFNAAVEAADTKELQRRQTISGNLIHASRAEAFQYYLRNQAAPKGGRWTNHPGGKPFCQGDGEKATRLYGISEGVEDWREIDCPHDLCEFRQSNPAQCKPFLRLYFRIRWSAGSPLPTPIVKLTSTSWYNAVAFNSFFEQIERQAAALGFSDPVLFGYPFTLTLQRKTMPTKQRAFPVIVISPDMDPISFFAQQRRQLSDAGASPVPLLPGALSPEENEVEAVRADIEAITPSTPGSVVTIQPATKPEPAHVANLRRLAAELRIAPEAIDRILGAKLETMPAGAALEADRKLREYAEAGL